MTKYNLRNHVTEPTRITSTFSTCLDFILTNHYSIINNTEVLPPFQSNHCTVTAEVAYKIYRIRSQKKKTIWKYDNANINAIETILENTDWSFIENMNDIDEINDKFTNLLLKQQMRQFLRRIFTTGQMISPGWTMIYVIKWDKETVSIVKWRIIPTTPMSKIIRIREMR